MVNILFRRIPPLKHGQGSTRRQFVAWVMDMDLRRNKCDPSTLWEGRATRYKYRHDARVTCCSFHRISDTPRYPKCFCWPYVVRVVSLDSAVYFGSPSGVVNILFRRIPPLKHGQGSTRRQFVAGVMYTAGFDDNAMQGLIAFFPPATSFGLVLGMGG